MTDPAQTSMYSVSPADLTEAERRYLALFNSIDQGFCTIHVAFDAHDRPTDYRFVEVSPSFARQTGIADAEGRWMRDIAADQDEHWFEIYGRVSLTGEPARFEAQSTPLERWWSVYAFRLDDRPRGDIGVLFNDITERKQAEAALREADRRKDEFLATLAHELRNPLAPIRTGLELIRIAGDSPGAVAQVRAIMERQVAHMVRLIDDLLDVSRITAGKIQLRREHAPLDILIGDAIEAHRAAIAAKQVALRVALPAAPCVVDVDPTRFVQVVSNLLHNAAKFTNGGGSIDVSAQVRDGAATGAGDLVVSVKDSGIGIAPELLPRVFEPFTQGDCGSAQPGLGLGLALAQRLVEMHAGHIDVRSDGPGQGSEFVVRLPASVRQA